MPLSGPVRPIVFRLPLLIAALALTGPAARAAPPSAPAAAPQPATPASPASPDDAIARLLPGERWIAHARQDLLPFWDLPDAWGEPRGNFPTVRCNDGTKVDPARPCDEVRFASGWIRELSGKTFVRMQSRQTYAYGVAYHLTGDAHFLALARDGVQWIRTHALQPDGGAVSWFEDGKGGPPALERTSQDLAYAAVGLAMYYHLTRDEAVLRDLLRLKEYVFARYWDARWGMLRWVVEDPAHEEEKRQELVAQLDQVNAYMLLLAPELPEPHRTRWTADLVKLARLMIDRYWSPEEHVFWGTIHDADGRRLQARHVDFGHTGKALWMIDRIGRLAGDADLVAFARREGAGLLRRAYLPSGSWGQKPLPGGGVDAEQSWWISAELDQLAATLALSEPALAAPLATTYPRWLSQFVDPVGHEVWGGVDAEGGAHGGLKIHPWKSGYHSMEHALVSYLTTQALRGQPATLHFALPAGRDDLRAYYFGGHVERTAAAPLPGFEGRKDLAVTFTGLR